MSASRSISSTSSSVSFSPRLVMMWRSSAAEMKPLPSLSNTLNASRISSSESVSFILRAIIVRNSGKSIVPLPSASTSLIMSASSASVGFWPSERITVPSSFVVIVPSPSLSNREKASLNSAICSSVSWSAMMNYERCFTSGRGEVVLHRFYSTDPKNLPFVRGRVRWHPKGPPGHLRPRQHR
ncbi:unnamed protein product [Pelagomonas calceolata]|uniref:Uncharacterized protein n=1 Tax=Pelagomonas calceolata TaxID=35677 RepID=A0A8J2SL15_9STRA|nr:unnamed protein product [Pelagomonas calceolata]